jgi:23S rRNA (cytosine1962-C5)-methyltransferase
MSENGLTEDFQNQAQMFANRVKKRFNHLYKRFARQNIDVFRLYDWDIPEIRAVVDWYGGHLVIGEYMRRQSVPGWLPAMGRAVGEALDVPAEKVHLKQRRAGKQDGKRYKRLDHTNRMFAVAERDLRFYVNPYDFVDTGLFADHRNTRQMVREMAAGKDFLNLYCYTAAFSCYAARGGAQSTLSVDRSQTSIQWARQNLRLNCILPDINRLVQADVLGFLKSAKRRGQIFDIAVVDPPSYSTTRVDQAAFDIFRDHPVLLRAVIDVMRKGAVILFSTNHQGFALRTEDLPDVDVTEITALTIPEDYRNKKKTIHRCWRINL